jgi:hypothetical protein
METTELLNRLVGDIVDGNNASARDAFGDLMALKVTNALDQRKQELAQTVFSAQPEEE